MARFFNLPIRIQLIVLVILLTLPALGLVVYAGIRDRTDAYRAAVVESQMLADTLAAQQNLLARETRQLAALIAKLPDVKRHDSNKVTSLLAGLLKENPQYMNILIADAAGNVWSSAASLNTPHSVADRRCFKNARQTLQFASGEFALSESAKKPTIHMAYPLVDDNEFQGAVVVAYDLDSMRSILKQLQLPEYTNYIFTDHRGIIIGRGRNAGQEVGKTMQRADLQKMEAGPDKHTYEFVLLDRDRRIVTYRKLRLEGEQSPYMYIRAGLSRNAVLASNQRGFVLNVGFMSAVVLLAIAFAFYISKRGILDKVIALRGATQKVARGDYDVRVADYVSGGELGELGCAFDEMTHRLKIDISERKQTEELLSKNEERLRVIFETSQAGIIMVSPNGVISFANKRMAEMFGCSMEDLIGSAYPDHLHPGEKLTGDSRMRQLIAGEIDYVANERHYLRKDGSDFWGYLSGRRIETADGHLQALVGIIADITDRKRAEEQLQQSETKFSATFKISPDSININRLADGVFVDVNEGFTAMLGYTADEVIGNSLPALGIWVDPEDRTRFAGQLRAHGIINNLEAKLRRKDGTIITVLISSRLIEINGEPCTLSIARDITERENIQKELIKIQKLESLGVLAGGIAHDFNNILTGIMGNISFAKMIIDESHEVYGLLSKAEKASCRAAELSKQLLVFAKGGQPIKKMVSLQQVVAETVALALSGTNVKGEIDIPLPLHTVEADEGQLNQSFHNIIINAVHSMPGGGILTIRGENAPLGANNAGGLPAGNYVKLSFTDQGCGISASDQKKIFDPYFTTKAGGTGLGLASTYAIINQHGGRITVDSTIGSGTTFTVYLPSLGETVPVQGAVGKGPTASQGHGSILVMDDDEMVRELATMTLERAGYTVTECVNGEEAIAIYTTAINAGTPFSLVIMDLTIPGGMGGLEAARLIAAIDPEATLIVSSGYSDDPVMSNPGEYGFCAAIEKPYKANDIAAVLAGIRKKNR